MSASISRDDIVKKICGTNEKALRMGLLINSQTTEGAEPPAETVDIETDSAIGIMAASGDKMSQDETDLLHLVDELNWSGNQVGGFLQVLAIGE